MEGRVRSSHGATIVLVLAALVAGLALGARVLGVGNGGAGVADSAPVRTGDPALGELVAELRGLRERLERREAEALAAPPRLESRAVVPARGSEDTAALVAALDARLASLESAIARLAAAQAEGVAPVSSLQFPDDDFEPLPWPVRDEVSTTEFSQRHLYWTSQQVVDAYGLPAEVSATRHDQHVWSYMDGDGEDLEFVFHRGVLLRVEW